MRIGFLNKFNPERITFMKKHGFGCTELSIGPDDPFIPGKDGWKDKAAQVKTAYDRAGIRISCLAGFYDNHMDPNPNVAKQHREHVRNSIKLAQYMGVPVVAGFAGRVMDGWIDNSIKRFKEIWSEHAKFAEDHGIKIAFENCPMGWFHTPFFGNNCICTPEMWSKCFNAVPSEALGLEWDPSHLICQFIDPELNVREFARKIFHVHGKDAKVYHDKLDRFGMFSGNAIEHCFPGLGDSNWGTIIKELRRAGYNGDINIEGWHDSTFRNHKNGPKLENLGLLIAKRHLEQFVDGE
ncbi:MAG: sugar phosphate isomerase/epimerase [Planctomycetota bacterium]|nr:MAG: sugar phosphate isomerase/epimerase [Planctomycetota bacterium]